MTPMSIDKFKATLKKKGMKATPQRLAVHQEMINLLHASADMIFERLKGNAGISLASIYNVLSDLCEAGIYKPLKSASNKMFYDINSEPHVHLYDSQNHTFVDISDEEVLDIVSSHFKGRRFRGYRIDGYDVQIMVHATRKTH